MYTSLLPHPLFIGMKWPACAIQKVCISAYIRLKKNVGKSNRGTTRAVSVTVMVTNRVPKGGDILVVVL